MAYHITEDCLSCGACELECPNRAISEGADRYQIDPTRCTECIGFRSTPRCAEVCPNRAPAPDPNRKEDYDQLMARFRQLHPGLEPKGLVLLQDKSKPVIALIADGAADKAGEAILQTLDSLVRKRFPGNDVVWGLQAVYMFPAVKARGQDGYFERSVPLTDAAGLLAKLAAAGRQKVAMQMFMSAESSFSRNAKAADKHGMDVKYALPFLAPPENRVAIIKALQPYFGDGITTATVMVGHGAVKNFEENQFLVEMDRYLRDHYRNAFLAPIHGPPSIDGVIEDLKKSGCRKVRFVSLMMAGGGHVSQDIMGDQPDSWKNRIGLPANVFNEITEQPIFINYFVSQIERLLSQFE